MKDTQPQRTIGIRKEDKNQWERRVALTPEDVEKLIHEHHLTVVVQPSTSRAFLDDQYRSVGALVETDLSPCSVIFAVKEIPIPLLLHHKTYVFFSHVIKGQAHNMPMLKQLMDLECTLIDYERIIDTAHRRMIYFGNYAGIAGMIDTLWATGQSFKAKGIDTPFLNIHQAYQYPSLEEALESVRKVRDDIASKGLPDACTPFICGFLGYGNVSKGAQSVFDLFPVTNITPSQLQDIPKDPKTLYKVVFKESDIAKPVDPEKSFDLNDYYTNPEYYQSQFEPYIPHLSILLNCIYWEKRYPKFVTKAALQKLAESTSIKSRLIGIGDISCDIEGAMECTLKETDSEHPAFTYHPLSMSHSAGINPDGIFVIAISNLPAELPKESSTFFSNQLKPFVPILAETEITATFDAYKLPLELKNAVIVYKGQLTPNYRYLSKFLSE